jgi:glycerol-3-phosphate dehydrogenase
MRSDRSKPVEFMTAMTTILREPSNAASQTYDLIIVGGGVYGAMLSLEASRRGLRSLLLERGDFGGETSHNSLRIVHGGFRYLQTLDFKRFFESIRERQWFLQTFPNLVQPLPCLMPLYGIGIRRSDVLRTALLLNDILSANRNHNVRSDRHLPVGKVITSEQVHQFFPLVDWQDLQGGAVWYDASMPDSQRLLIAILRWSCALGGVALNYVEAQALLKAKTKNNLTGLLARDLMSYEVFEYRASVVVNAAGPWCRELAADFDRDIPNLFRASLAWNVLFDRASLSDFALAVTPKQSGSKTYFIHPWKGRLLAGTLHNPWSDDGIISKPMPSSRQITEFLADLNTAIPGLDLSQQEILRIFSGLLPVTQSHSIQLSNREIMFDHGKQGGPQGLYSVSGVKFTTSRLVAEKTIKKIFSSTQKSKDYQKHSFLTSDEVQNMLGIYDYDYVFKASDRNWKNELSKIITEESVQHLDDLILRRTSIGDNPQRALASASLICQLFPWDNTRCQQEIFRLEKLFTNDLSA